MKALVGPFNQEKAALVVAFSVIVKTDGSFAALLVTGGDNITKQYILRRDNIRTCLLSPRCSPSLLSPALVFVVINIFRFIYTISSHIQTGNK